MTIDTEIDEISTEDSDDSGFRAPESRTFKSTYFIVAFNGLERDCDLSAALS
jgi:hypothetical protein